jgi:hypothetical protein
MASWKRGNGPAKAPWRLTGKDLTGSLQDLLLHPWVSVIMPDQKVREIIRLSNSSQGADQIVRQWVRLPEGFLEVCHCQP